MEQFLVDKFGRKHDYLRISLIERCNLRCHYCMPEDGIQLRDKSEFMSQEELFKIVDEFVALGIKKIRLTGGEPLIKKNFAEILKHLASLGVELNITTNGILLDKYWDDLKAANVKSLNISIDSLEKDKFNAITRRNYFDRVYQNIITAVEKGFDVKLNAVLIKNENDGEIIDFIELTKKYPFSVRFIEFMPFDGNKWDWSKTVSYETVLSLVNFEYGDKLKQLQTEPNGTSRNFQVKGYKGSFGIISSVTNPFCDSCNRIRLTADGKIKNCLFSEEETDLLTALRKGKDVKHLIFESINSKHKERAGLKAFEAKDFKTRNRSMISIGG
ncbi:MAG: GTP 3',8-cyclase MoaA [Crocinitomicaceae bacterium]|nr:GTP 3',8-cyclase MoaA [Crocinitomicaceae bacterium]